jgi:hypothetical protein
MIPYFGHKLRSLFIKYNNDLEVNDFNVIKINANLDNLKLYFYKHHNKCLTLFPSISLNSRVYALVFPLIFNCLLTYHKLKVMLSISNTKHNINDTKL